LKVLIILPAVSAILLGFGIYQIFFASKIPSQSFTFIWGPDEQHIVDGELRLEMDFKWTNESLSILAKINDNDRYFPGNYLGLVFDTNHDGITSSSDKPFLLFAGNETVYRGDVLMLPSGRLTFSSVEPIPSPWHTCIFSKATGYTFNITFSKDDLGLTPGIMKMYDVTKIKIHVVYEMWGNYDVHTQFYLEVDP
jgi:hypothetical protein